MFENGEDFLKKITTGDGTGVRLDDPENTRPSVGSGHPGSPQPIKSETRGLGREGHADRCLVGTRFYLDLRWVSNVSTCVCKGGGDRGETPVTTQNWVHLDKEHCDGGSTYPPAPVWSSLLSSRPVRSDRSVGSFHIYSHDGRACSHCRCIARFVAVFVVLLCSSPTVAESCLDSFLSISRVSVVKVQPVATTCLADTTLLGTVYCRVTVA